MLLVEVIYEGPDADTVANAIENATDLARVIYGHTGSLLFGVKGDKSTVDDVAGQMVDIVHELNGGGYCVASVVDKQDEEAMIDKYDPIDDDEDW